mmetsp:Transcript_39995/g.72512  ORF Transcript_39995/g.72512 Transcript_39995/m.72512 type:complete len:144 (-) Transcript_39995:306-737(-)
MLSTLRPRGADPRRWSNLDLGFESIGGSTFIDRGVDRGGMENSLSPSPDGSNGSVFLRPSELLWPGEMTSSEAACSEGERGRLGGLTSGDLGGNVSCVQGCLASLPTESLGKGEMALSEVLMPKVLIRGAEPNFLLEDEVDGL